MADGSPVAGAPSSTLAETRAHALGLCFLLAAGAWAVALGAILLLGVWKEVDRFLPYLLLAVGVGTLASSVGLLLSPGEAARVKLDRPRATSPAKAGPSSPAPRRTEAGRPTPKPRDSRPHSGLGRAVVSAASRTGDEIWRRWTTPIARPLGVELAGPVPETAHSAPKSGGFVAFPRRSQDLQFVTRARPGGTEPDGFLPPAAPSPHASAPSPPSPSNAARSPPPPRPQPGPFSETELDALFPCAPPSPPAAEVLSSPRTVPPSGGPNEAPRSENRFASDAADETSGRFAVGNPAAAPPQAARPEVPVHREPSPIRADEDMGPLLAGPLGLLPVLDSQDHVVAFEATNPTPPHLRLSPYMEPDRLLAGRSGTGVRESLRWYCTECSRALSDFRSWVQCRRCSRPMCRQCLTSSFLAGADGHCANCRSSQGTAAT